MNCPRCQHDNPSNAKFCLECGARLTLLCAKCQSELPSGAKFCLECGEPVASRASAGSRFAGPETVTPKYLAQKILTSKTTLEGERKQVTVLFADLKGSMELLAGVRDEIHKRQTALLRDRIAPGEDDGAVQDVARAELYHKSARPS